MNQDWRGFNNTNVVALREIINTTAQSCGTTIVEDLKNGIVTPISTAWYAPEAVEYFEAFKTAVAECGQSITDVFENFKNNVKSAGEYWGENTKSTDSVDMAAIDLVELALDVSAIQQKDPSGNIYLDMAQTNTVIGKLSEVKKDIETHLGALAETMKSEDAFIGGGQAASIDSCFVEVTKSVHKIFDFLTEGEESLSSQLTSFVNKYSEMAEKVTTGFNSTAVDGDGYRATGNVQ